MEESKGDARTEARLRYIRSSGKKTLRQIAEEVGVPLSTVKSWKQRDKWDDEAGTVKSATGRKGPDADADASKSGRKKDAPWSSEKKKRGGQTGNKNAYGNKGGAAPVGNKNAVSTGAYERVMYATFSEDEKELIQDMPLERDLLLIDQIRILTIREKRMLERIDEVKKSAKSNMIPSSMRIVNRGETAKATDGYSENVMYMLNRLEEALTRVQQRKQAAIDALHRYRIEDTRFMPKGGAQPGDDGDELDDVQISRVLAGMSDDELRRYASLCDDYNSGGGEL